MNNNQIARVLEQDSFTSKKFCGVFPSDRLPETIERYPCGFVANTDPSNQPGTHWVAFYFSTERKGEFFDSYGEAPDYYNISFKNYLDKHSYDWEFNKRKLQSIWSDVCGHYCIFYLNHRARGYSMNKIVNMFGNNSMSNDNEVFIFVNRRFNIPSKVLDKERNQSSRKFIER